MLYLVVTAVFLGLWVHWEITDPQGRWYDTFHSSRRQ